jgi:4-amino-4-deoxy-L-arabinose transferase-like glycosyltransferase
MATALERPTETDAGSRRGGHRAFWWWVAAIAAVAVALRVLYVATTLWDKPLGDDAQFYFLESTLLAHGHFFVAPFVYTFSLGRQTLPTAAHPPLFTVLLAVAHLAGVHTENAYRVLCCFLGAIVVVPVALLGRDLAGERVGLLAAGLAALYPARVVADGDVFAESVYAALVATLLLLAYRTIREPTPRRAVAFGLVAGLAIMTRGEAILLFVLVALAVVVVLDVGWRRRAVLLGPALVAAVVVVMPWTIYNATRFSEPVFVSTNEGGTFAGANCAATYNGPAIGLWIFGCEFPHGKPLSGDDSQQDHALRKQGFAYVSGHADRLPSVVGARIGRTFYVFRPEQSVIADTGRGWTVFVVLAGYWATLALGIAGACLVHRRRTAPLAPMVVAVVSVVVTAAVFYANFRFRVPLDLVLIVLSAVALDAAWTLVEGRLAARARDGRRPATLRTTATVNGATGR